MDTGLSMELYVKRMSMMVSIVSLVIVVGGAVYLRSAAILVFSLGVVITAILNIVKIHWLKRSIDRATEMEATSGHLYIRGQGMLRMFLTLAVLVGAGFLSQIDIFGLPMLIGAVLGLLTMPVAAYSMALFKPKDHEKI